MKKIKPNLKKMLLNFHTIILVTIVIVVSILHTHTSEAKLQRLHKHHHNHNHKQHAVVADASTYVDDDDEDILHHQRSHGQHKSDHHHQHQYHNHNQHHHHYHRQQHFRRQQQQLQRHDVTTPSLEFTTSSSSSASSPSSSSAAIFSDNEFLIKQQEQPLTHKDEIYYKTKDLKSLPSTSTTSKPSLSIHLIKQSKNLHNFKTSSSSNSTSTHAANFANSKREHTQHNHNKRLISTPLTKPEGNNSGIDDTSNNNRTENVTTMLAEGLENENYENWNAASRNEDANTNSQHQNHSHHIMEKPVSEHEQHQRQQEQQQHQHQQYYEDYYSDAEDDEIDDEADDDYSEDEADNDGISDDNIFSDRSYARITRSKLDDDYIDDEPYRNGINELSMQRDAAPGVLTEQKYLEVGNEKAVQQARERYIQEQKRPRTPHELATEHWHRMIQATKCRKPLPRVIPVSNNTSKRYEPYATILHRCGDDTGCCGSTASVCTVKRHEIVMVYVFSYDFNYRKEIEALPMQNHTECHCVNRGSLLHDSMPRDKRSGGSGIYSHHSQRQQRRQQEQQQQQQQQQQHHLSSESQSHAQQQQQHQMQNMLDCHCPRHFNVFEDDVERHVHLPKPHSVFIRKCRCDCLVNNQTCLRFKHGEEGFSLEDRKCVLERNCKPPVCLYGDYNLRVGRCPSYRSHLMQMT